MSAIPTAVARRRKTTFPNCQGAIGRHFAPAADPSGPVSIWWGAQVTILASHGIGFTDRSASLAEYHPKFFQLQGPKSKEPGLLSLIRAPWSGTVIF